jgi:hypothetical protein
MKKLLVLLVCLSCGYEVPDRVILDKGVLENGICSFTYKHNTFHGPIVFQDSCKYYKIGDKINFPK